MRILHITTECYPAAKAGGLGDVAGALPKYQRKLGADAAVIMPKHHTRWMVQQEFRELYRGFIRLHNHYHPFIIQQYWSQQDLGFPLYVVHVPGRFDREGVYAGPDGWGYGDEVERNLIFQQAVLQWLQQIPARPEVIHCHDHHTGLVPFLVKYCPDYRSLSTIPTVFTIHNGQYHGSFGWDKMYLLPFFYAEARGVLDWNDRINPLATGIKCAWQVTTVSPGYLDELTQSANGLEPLIQSEWSKCRGILNGIDSQVWNPHTDHYLATRMEGVQVSAFKTHNKNWILQRFGLTPDLPLMTFIGRLVGEKGTDVLPEAIDYFYRQGGRAVFVMLGTGQKWLENQFRQMMHRYPGYFHAALEYNEGLAHQLYAGSDFLLMPSRVEPCGLNQMYAMRYGTVPIVRKIGGLKDTVIDLGDPGGRGFTFQQLDPGDAAYAMYRAAGLYRHQEALQELRRHIMSIDFSWERSAGVYLDLYQTLQ